MKLRVLMGFWSGMICLGMLGCGDGKPETVPASGKVMFNTSTPAEGALVVFHPLDPEYEKKISGKPFAKVKADGTFVLSTYGEEDGAPVGEYGVTIDWRGEPKPSKNKKFTMGTEGVESEGGLGSGKSILNPKFGNPQNPAFKVTITKGADNQFTFDVN